ncbi:MAG: T9SS type A sorting domain-containing protein [Candidatus Kapabacteria bacterium]|nr:T9SS type A sorting domain-containing protein [Candidatus Kapabacteria bacterium]
MIKKLIFILALILFIENIQLIAQWKEINNGLSGTEATAIFKYNNTLFAGTNNGLYKSQDDGKNWSKIISNIPSGKITSITNLNNKLILSVYDKGIYISSDMGNSWIEKNESLKNKSILEVITAKGNIYASSEGSGLYISSNNGDTWVNYRKDIYATFAHNTIVKGDTIILSTSDGLNISFDNGLTWKTRNTGLSHTNIVSIYLDGDTLFAGTYKFTHKTTNYGETWQLANESFFYNYIVKFVKTNKNLISVPHVGLIRTENNFKTWEYLDKDINGFYNNNLFVDENNTLFLATSSGVMVSKDMGDNWQFRNNGLGIPNVIRSFSSFDDKLYSCTSSGLYYSTNSGDFWEKGTDLISQKTPYFIENINNEHYLSNQIGIYKFDINSKTWKRDNYKGTSYVTSIACNSNMLFLSTGGNDCTVYFRKLNDTNWLSNSISLQYSGITSMLWNNNELLIATEGTKGLFSSNDKVETITYKGLIGNSIYKLISNGKYIYACTYDKGVFISDDNGSSWKATGTEIKDKKVSKIAIVKDKVYVIAGSMLYYSLDNCSSWKLFNFGIEDKFVYDFYNNNEFMFLSTDAGIYRATLSDIEKMDVENPVVQDNLSFYPNPAMDFLNIKLEGEPQSNEEIEVFDLMGQKVLTQKVDNINTNINIQNLNTGIYYAKLKQSGSVFKFEVIN